jgi:hypothetical protein
MKVWVHGLPDVTRPAPALLPVFSADVGSRVVECSMASASSQSGYLQSTVRTVWPAKFGADRRAISLLY